MASPQPTCTCRAELVRDDFCGECLVVAQMWRVGPSNPRRLRSPAPALWTVKRRKSGLLLGVYFPSRAKCPEDTRSGRKPCSCPPAVGCSAPE